jgi:hypothetical protein
MTSMVSIDLNLLLAAVTALSVTGSLVFVVYRNFVRPRLTLDGTFHNETADGSSFKIFVTMRGSGSVAKGCHIEVFHPEIGVIEPALIDEVRTRSSVELFTVKGGKLSFKDHITQERQSFDLSVMRNLKIKVSITSENTEGDHKEMKIADILAK